MNWIDCNEQLPEENQRVLIYIREDATSISDYTGRVRIFSVTFERAEQYGNNERPYRWEDHGPGYWFGQDATHWMPLPEPPQAHNEPATADTLVSSLLELYKAADEERLRETEEAHQEAAKWKAEGDMYGWNFHEGRAGGTTSASIIFYRIRRWLEAHKKAA